MAFDSTNVTKLPEPPISGDANFDEKADVFLPALVVFSDELDKYRDDLITYVEGQTTGLDTKVTAADASATAAANSASTAAIKATEAANSASSAATKATEASSSAAVALASKNAAATSATSASNSASTASTAAGTASTKASEASASATLAGTKAGEAASSAGSASSSADTATTKAAEATTSASTAATHSSNASASAAAAAGSATTASTKASEASASAATATQKALDATNSANYVAGIATALAPHVDNKANPHDVTKMQVGLGNVTNDAQIPKSIGTAKGDLIGFSNSGIPVRVPVGINGKVLTADDTSPLGIIWKEATGGFKQVFVTGDYTANSLDLVEVNTLAEDSAITLPASGMVEVYDAGGNCAVNNITVKDASANILAILDVNYGDILFRYNTITSSWDTQNLTADGSLVIPTASQEETAARIVSDKYVTPNALRGLILQPTQITNAGFGVWSNGTLESAVSSVNLITNGEFETDLSGWTAGNGATLTRDTTTSASGSACLKVTNSGATNGYASFAVTTVPGRVYKVVAKVKSNGTQSLGIYAGTTPGSYDIGFVASSLADFARVELFFEAVGTTTHISCTNPASSGLSCYYDSITLYDMGVNLVTNGTFNSNTTGWGVTSGTIASVAGGINENCLQVTNGTSVNGRGYRQITGLEIGKLYRLGSFLKSGTTTAGMFIGSSPEAYDILSFNFGWSSLASWTYYSGIFEATTTSIYITCWTGSVTTGQTALFDSITLTEVTVGCVDYNTKACDLWTKDTTAQCWRETIDTKEGSYYALRVYGGRVNWIDGGRHATKEFLARYTGRAVALGMWVKCSSANKARIGIGNQTTTDYSNYHSGNGQWEWLEVTVTPSSSVTQFFVTLDAGSGTVAYFSQPQLQFGTSVGQGNFVPIPGEYVPLDNVLTSAFLNGSARSSLNNVSVSILSDFLGKLPNGLRTADVRLSASDSTATYRYVDLLDESLTSQVSLFTYETAWVFSIQGRYKITGDKYIVSSLSGGTNTLSATLRISGVYL